MLRNRVSYGYDHDGNSSRTRSPASYGNGTSPDAPFATGSKALRTITQHWPDGSVKAIFQPLKADTGADTTDQFRRTRFAYDDAGRKTKQAVDNPGTATTILTDSSAFSGVQSYAYWPSDLLKTETGRGNSGVIDRSYDPDGNLTTLTNTPATGGPVSTAMTYYLDGLPRTSSQSGRTTSYSYNGNGAPLARSFEDADAVTRTSTSVTSGGVRPRS